MSETRRKILIVDDDKDLLQAMKNMFRKNNFDILLATDGEEALRIVEKELLSLIISDVRMPRMSGVQLLEAINERGLEIPVIIVTGYSDYSEAEIDERNGVVLLNKATDVTQLKSIVAEYLDLLPEPRKGAA